MDPDTHRETFGYDPIGEDLGAPDFSGPGRRQSTFIRVISVAALLFVAFAAVSFLLTLD